MTLDEAKKFSSCEECKMVAERVDLAYQASTGVDLEGFGIYNGHIYNKKATLNLGAPCLCNAEVKGLS